MGAPSMGLAELRQLAREFSLDFLELRTVEGTTDLPQLLVQGSLEAPHGTTPPIRLVASNLRLLNAGAADVENFLGYAAVADHFGAPYVRVFGGGAIGQDVTGDELASIRDILAHCRRALKSRGLRCEILLETHFAFSSAQTCRRLNDSFGEPVPILWDSHHTWRRGGETPEEAWNLIGPWVRHIHYKDSRMEPGAKGDGRYVLPGHGEFPSRELMRLLRAQGYAGGLSLEWEKLWHPELPDLRDALADFVEITGRV